MSDGALRGVVQTTTAGVTTPASPDSDEAALLDGLRSGEAWARLALFERYGRHVMRILGRVLGSDPELPDVLHDAFVEAYGSVGSIRDAAAIKGWMSTVAVFTARRVIRRRKVRRWLRFWDPAELPEQEGPSADPAMREALTRSYRVLDTIAAQDRIAFCLRFMEGMDLTDVASACSCSLATVKRRIARAERAFLEGAATDDVLRPWIERGRWAER